VILVASLLATTEPGSAATLTGYSVTPSSPVANAAGSMTYSLGFSAPSATAAKCILVSFESDNGTIPAPSNSAWQYQGGSTSNGSGITLTTPSQSFAGTIGAYVGAVPSEGLHATFNGYMGDGSGADGMTFTFLDPNAYGGFAGSSGGGLGYSGLTGIAVTMVTSWDGTVGSSNFMGVATSGSGSTITYAGTNTGVASLRTTHAYDVRVSSGHVIVKLDGTQVLDVAVALPSMVYPAFTAGTGGSTDTHSVSSVAITYTGAGAGGTASGLPPGMTLSSPTLTGSTAVTAASWGTGTNWNDRVAWTYASGQALSAGTLVVNGVTHNPAASGTYYARLETFTDTGCTTALDSAAAAFAITDAVTVTMTVDPELTFTVNGYNSGACNGTALTATASTGTTMPLGHLTPAANAVGGQALSVTTNAASGYTVYASSAGPMSDGRGHTIADWSGTNTNPTTFAAPGSSAALGYTTDHALSSAGAGTTRFQSGKWAGLTTSNAEVAYVSSGPVADSTHVCFQLAVTTASIAGPYASTVTYTAVPVF